MENSSVEENYFQINRQKLNVHLLVTTNGKRKLKKIIPEISLSLLVSFLLLFYAPVQLYARNTDDFIYDLYDLLKMITPVFVIGFIACSGILMLTGFLGKRIHCTVLAICAAGILSSYIEGNFLSGFIPELTGKGIDWTLYSSHRWYSILLWGCVMGLLVCLAFKIDTDRFTSFISYFSGLGTAMLVLTLFFTLNGDVIRDKESFYATKDQMLELSSDRNYILMVLDTIDGVHFDNAIKENPDYKESLENFTFYNNALGTYPGTKWAIPFFLSGTWFENQCGYYKYREDAYANSPLFSSLKEKGYRMGLYQEDPPLMESLLEEFENLSKPESEELQHPVEFCKMQLMLTGLSYLPFDLKRFCELTPDNIYYDSLKETSGDDYFTWDNRSFLNTLQETGISVSDGAPCFRMYVLQGTHEPYEDSLETAVTDCFDLMTGYISALKNAGVYDNTVLIIMGDHGYFPSETYKMNPALFIKGFNEDHKFVVSDAPVSYADFPESFLRLLNGATGTGVFDAQEGETRKRRFLNPYVIDDGHIVEMIHTGHASDVTAFVETGTIYTPQ